MDKVYESPGWAITKDPSEGVSRPFHVVYTGGATGMGQVEKTARTYWQAVTLLLYLSERHETFEEALEEAARRERASEAHEKYLADQEVRLWSAITMVKALAPGNDTKVFMEHLGGGIVGVAIYPEGTDAYCWITDTDGFIMMGFYESPEDEVGVMVEPLGQQQYNMETDEGMRAIADTLRTFYMFFKPSA